MSNSSNSEKCTNTKNAKSVYAAVSRDKKDGQSCPVMLIFAKE